MVGYSIPTNGVRGTPPFVQGRHPYRRAHLHALIVKPGSDKVLISQVYDPRDPHIDSDVQFGVHQSTDGMASSGTTKPIRAMRAWPPPGTHSTTPTRWKPVRRCFQNLLSSRAHSAFVHRSTNRFAARSTGPRSAEGKARASRNAWKGGSRPMLRALAQALVTQGELLETMEGLDVRLAAS